MEPSLRIGEDNVFDDSEGVIKLSVNRHASRRTKPTDVKHQLVKDVCNAGKIGVVHVRTEDQHADLFTKQQHAHFIPIMGVGKRGAH